MFFMSANIQPNVNPANPLSGNIFANPTHVEALSAISTKGGISAPAAPANPGKHLTPDQLNLPTIISKLDGDFINSYFIKLEEAKAILKMYLDRLGDFSRRIAKADRVTKKVLGEDALIEK